MLSLTKRYTLHDINENFEERALRAAPVLIGSVAEVEPTGDYMHCELRNRNSTRIKVDIFFSEMKIEGQPYLVIDSDCSCKTGYSCEHAAAALLFMLQQRAASAGLRGSSTTPSPAVPQVNPGLLHWVETLRRASGVEKKSQKPRPRPLRPFIT